MALGALSSTSVTLPLGGLWSIEVEVRDEDGWLVDEEPAVTVTLPNASTTSPDFENVSTGFYRAEYTVASAGRHVARVTTIDDAVDFVAFAQAVTTAGGMPTIVDVDVYLGDNSWSDPEKQSALDAEAAAQRAVCRVGAVYTADLREALLRRVQRNLAMRKLPLPQPQGDSDNGAAFLPRNDPEVRRLEGPYRKLVIG